MRIVTKAEYPGTRPELIAALDRYRAALEAHKTTVGVPAPWPEYEVFRALVKLTPEEWILESEAPAAPTQPISLEAVRVSEQERIDAEAVAARAKYASPLLLQGATYKEKYEDAVAFLGADPGTRDVADFPYIAAEASETGADPETVATTIKSQGDMWRAINATIEGKRIAAKQQVRDAATLNDVLAVRPAIEWP